MSTHFNASYNTGDVIQFKKTESEKLEIENNHSEVLDIPENPPKCIRSPSTYGCVNPQFYPKSEVHYDIISVTWNIFHTAYIYEIQRKDGQKETIMFVIYESASGIFYCCIDQTHFKPYQIYIDKV